jgi:hypothetical protein
MQNLLIWAITVITKDLQQSVADKNSYASRLNAPDLHTYLLLHIYLFGTVTMG